MGSPATLLVRRKVGPLLTTVGSGRHIAHICDSRINRELLQKIGVRCDDVSGSSGASSLVSKVLLVSSPASGAGGFHW